MTVRHGFFDSDGRLLRELDESERQAISAVGAQVAKQHTCVIAKNGGKPALLGSGTLVRVGDHVFVATAKHLFDSVGHDELIAIYWGEDDRRAGVYRRGIACDDRLDLAVIPTPNDIPPCGVPLENLEFRTGSVEEELFVVSGIPGAGFSTNDASKTVVVGHYSLGLVGLPEGAWPSHIKGPSANDVDILFNYTDRFALDDHGEPMPQIDPRGLSGGGLWSVPVQSEGVWSPTHAKLVAIQWGVEASKYRYLRATRIRHWLILVARLYSKARHSILRAFPELEGL